METKLIVEALAGLVKSENPQGLTDLRAAYYNTLITGILTGIMASSGLPYTEAYEIVRKCLPDNSTLSM
jgi:hypothetical protein